MKEEVLIVDVCKEVGIHHQYSVVVKGIYKLYAADGAEELRLAEGANLNAFTWSSEVLLYLFAKVVDGDVDMLHTIRNQSIYIVVNDALASNFEQRFRRLLCERT